MSLDVYLEGDETVPAGSGIFIREDGRNREITREEWDEKFPGKEPVTAQFDDGCELYNGNITHNLNTMADEAGIYRHLWRPEELDITYAHQLIGPLTDGLERLRADPDRYRKFNPENGWGTYEGLVQFVDEYLAACKASPTARVRTWR